MWGDVRRRAAGRCGRAAVAWGGVAWLWAAVLCGGVCAQEKAKPAEAERRAQAALAESPLTPRERDVVVKLLAGASTRTISETMGLTISTVNTYMKRIFAKLGVHSRVELVAWANGLR